MSLVLDTGTMKYRKNPNQPWRPLVIKAGMNWESMADTYDPDNGTYEVGQYVLEEGMMYRCISEITTPEAWTPAHWTSVNVGDELSSFIIISDDQPTDETNKIWIAETTAPFGVQVPTMDDHIALENTLNQLDAEKADEASLAYKRSGSTNTGAQIENGTYFYLDGTLKRAISTIATNADFTAQNYETVTVGGLNELSAYSSDTYTASGITLKCSRYGRVVNYTFTGALSSAIPVSGTNYIEFNVADRYKVSEQINILSPVAAANTNYLGAWYVNMYGTGRTLLMNYTGAEIAANTQVSIILTFIKTN